VTCEDDLTLVTVNHLGSNVAFTAGSQFPRGIELRAGRGLSSA